LDKNCLKKINLNPAKPGRPPKGVEAKPTEGIVNLNEICMRWLKEQHGDLYKVLEKRENSSLQLTLDNSSLQPTLDDSSLQPTLDDSSLQPTLDDSSLQHDALLLTSDESNAVSPSSQTHKSKSTISERRVIGGVVKSYFESIAIADGKACMTNSQSLLKYVTGSKLLGYGSFGNVYKVDVPSPTHRISKVEVAVKEGRISYSEFRNAMRKRYPIEYLFNKLINDLLDDRICPNFTYTHSIFFCDKCSVGDKAQVKTQCSETVVELFDFTLDKLTELSDQVVLSTVFQILAGVSSIQLKYGLFHADIKKENILVKTIPSGGCWTYIIDGKTYYVPNLGYIVALNDFGVSQAYKPGFGGKNLGRRQAMVVKERDGVVRLEPFTTRVYPQVGKSGSITPIVPPRLFGGGTWNQFYQNFDSKPSIAVDLRDMARFPAFHFHYDIMDVIYTFVGGKRTVQPGQHRPMKVSSNIIELFKDYCTLNLKDAWPLDRIDMFLANYTIHRLFRQYLENPPNLNIIETYTL
jgi:hypothetical protein